MVLELFISKYAQIVMKPKLYVCLDSIRSAYNVGSVFRTCDSAKVDILFLTGWTACPPNEKLEKTALGSDSIHWEHHCEVVPLVSLLKSQQVKIVAMEADVTAKSIFEADFTCDTCLFFGNEVTGVSQTVLKECDEVLQIPHFGNKDSLNIAVAAGIAIYEFRRKLLQK